MTAPTGSIQTWFAGGIGWRAGGMLYLPVRTWYRSKSKSKSKSKVHSPHSIPVYQSSIIIDIIIDIIIITNLINIPYQTTTDSSTMNRSSSLSRHSILEARARRRRRLQQQQQPPPPPATTTRRRHVMATKTASTVTVTGTGTTTKPPPSSSRAVVRHDDGDSLGCVLPVWISEDENNNSDDYDYHDNENENDPNKSTQSMIHREIDSFILPLDADAKEIPKEEEEEEDHERYDPYLVPISTIRQRLLNKKVATVPNHNTPDTRRLDNDDDDRPVPVPYVSIPRSHHDALSKTTTTTHVGTDHTHPNTTSTDTDSTTIIIMPQSLLLELIQQPSSSLPPTDRTDDDEGTPLDARAVAHHCPTPTTQPPSARGDGLRIERLQRWYHTENPHLDENLLFEL